MNRLQKIGGLAALYEAAAYIVGMIGFLLVVDVSGVTDPLQKVALIVENQAFLSALHLIVYVFWAVFMVVLSLALYERLRDGAPALVQTATALGLIWAGLIVASGMITNIGMESVAALYATDPAQAATVWLSIEAVANGIGGGNEIVGGLWILLYSVAALQTGGLPKPLNYLGIAIGVAGIASTIPALGDIGGMVFGLGQIIWFAWVGIAMLRRSPRAREALVPRATAG